MSEIAEIFNELKKIRQAKRASNREQSTQMLIDNGIEFTTHNEGVHLMVNANGTWVDFWPGTGLWMVLGSKHKHRGVSKLIAYVKRAKVAHERTH